MDSVTLFKNAKQKIAICDEESLTFSYVIEIFCKQLQHIRFCFDDISTASIFRFQLHRTCFSQIERDCFAFMNQSFMDPADIADGWKLFSLDREYVRMNLDSARWRITTVNSDYSLCESYPTRFIVPCSITDQSKLKKIIVASIVTLFSYRKNGRVS